jgi:hypothetical protein
VARVEGGVGPLEDEDPRARAVGDALSHGVQTAAEPGDQLRSNLLGAGGPADLRDAVDHVIEPLGIERNHLGVTADDVERFFDGTRRNGAYLAEVLGQDDVRIDRADPGVVERVDRLACRNLGTHLGVHLRRGAGAFQVERGTRHDGDRPRRLGIVALEADARELVTDAEREHNLGGGGKQRHDLHRCIIPHPRCPRPFVPRKTEPTATRTCLRSVNSSR